MDTIVMSQLGSQVFTQSSQPRRGGGTEKFVDALIKFSSRHPQSFEGVSEASKKAVIANLRILGNDNKWQALSKLLIDLCQEDRGARLFEFSHSIFRLSSLLPDAVESTQLVTKTIKFVTDVLTRCDVSMPNFFGMYNDLLVHLEEVASVEPLVEHISRQLEVQEDRKFNQRWKDFVAVILKKLREISGNDTADDVLFSWMKVTEDVDAFELIADVASAFSTPAPAVQKFCELIAEEIGVDSSADDVEAEIRRRGVATWKALILTTKTEKDVAGKLWNGVVCAWSCDGEKKVVTKELEKCLLVGHRVLTGSVEAARRFLAIIRTDKHRVLSSEFGLSLAIVQCSLDRNDALADMKKSLQKLWKIGEQSEECVWMSEIVCGDLLRIVDQQLRVLAESLASNERLRLLLSRPIFSLMLSLLDTPAHQKQVVIVDGRVADGCGLWLLARDILTHVSLAQSNMAAQLSLLFTSIASASNNSSALILIDVLHELVKKCSVEILNNSKLIDGLFDYVCRMRRDISVSLIRCLLPIINTRPQLRNGLFKSLKKDLLCESTVGSAVPIVLMLLRSVSKRKEDGGGGQFDHSMSQSFGSFSTQTLNNMGCKKNVDQAVGLELVGIVKRCLWQPAATKTALYDGVCELATQTSTMLSQFLDMMVSHAKTTPEWTRSELTTSAGTQTQLTEPLPHLIQTVECLISELCCVDGLDDSELLLKRATTQMETWVGQATRADISDLGLDKNAEWTNATANGRSSLLFAQMMLSTYDVLIEHMWRRVEASDGGAEEADKLVALLNRRKELETVYREKKEAKRDADDVLTGAKTLAAIMAKLMEQTGDDAAQSVKMELLEWCVGRAKVLTTAVVKEYRPLHSILTGTKSLMALAKSLMTLYIGSDVPSWASDIEIGTPLKTAAIESYANIVQYLGVKYKQSPARVTMLWFEEKEGEDEEARKKRQEPNILALRHAHFLSCRMFRQILDVENDDIEDEKKPKAQYELQSRAILRAATSALQLTKNVKVWSNLFSRVTKLLEEETFYNNQMLRDYCKFVTMCALRCPDSDKSTSKEMEAIMENILEFLSEEADQLKYRFVSKTSLQVALEFQFGYVEKTLALIREAFAFQKDFFVKPPVFDGMLDGLLTKCVEVTELVTRVLQIFVQYKMNQERVTEVMTNYFSTIQMGVLLLHNLTKGWGREMPEWRSVDTLAALVKSKLTPMLAMVDDHIGFSRGTDEMKKKLSQKTRYAKSKRDEKLFSKFSHEREAVQHGILVLCKLIKDDRFDLQIKNNSIGYRDFRIDMDVIRSKLGADTTEDPTEPNQKRRRRDETSPETDENQNPDEEEEEEPRAAEQSTSAVKQEVGEEDENDENDRSASPVY